MVSGIGPAAELRSLDIPVVADLGGVGQDMWVCYLVFQPQNYWLNRRSKIVGPARLLSRNPCQHPLSQRTL